jgi:hypothetical protein
MRGVWKSCLSLSLGLMVSGVGAEEIQWRPVATRTAPAMTAGEATAPSNAQPLASLGKPVLATSAAPTSMPQPADPQVRPASFVLPSPFSDVIARGQSLDAQPMPPGPGGVEKASDKSEQLHRPKELKVETVAPSPTVGGATCVSPCDCCCPADSCGCCCWLRRLKERIFGCGCCPAACCETCCTDCNPCGGCGSCGPCGCWWGGDGSCSDGSRLYGSAEYLLWFVPHDHTPALVTTGPSSSFGIIGNAGTQVLFGGPIDYGAFSGGRFTLGYWFDNCQTIGIEGNFLFLGQKSVNFSAASNSTGTPLLSRPFIDATTRNQLAEPVSFPGEVAGSINVQAKSQLYGSELYLRWNPCCCCFTGCCGGTYRIGLLGGFRFLKLDESLNISEDLTELGDTVSRQQLSDNFGTHNQFWGGQIGTVIEWRRGCWSVDLKTKVALGGTRENVNISGSEVDTTLNTGAQQRFNSGFLALPTNIGKYNRDLFGVVPEVGLTIGYQLTDHLRLFAGYNFLYWSNVVRPGRQIDNTVNVSQLSGGTLVGPARPAFTFNGSNFWAQGATFGLELKY